jgi:uncharacterized membrane protein YdjX (TVP38/TMEM64 family)
VLGAIILWRSTPLAQWASTERIGALIEAIKAHPWAPAIVIAVFVGGGLVAFPLTVLIGATAAVFDAWMAVLLSFAGTLASASVTYFIGWRFVRGTAHRAFGKTLERLRSALEGRGMIAIAVIRTIPIAPFSVVNVAAGTLGVSIRDYLCGTALGIAPGVVILTAFGHQLRQLLQQPTALSLAVLAGIICAWIALSLLLQRVLVPRRTNH